VKNRIKGKILQEKVELSGGRCDAKGREEFDDFGYGELGPRIGRGVRNGRRWGFDEAK